MFVPSEHGCRYVIAQRIGGEILQDAAGKYTDFSVVDANARVIAAAPDGLAFARAFVDNIDEWEGEPSPGQRWHKEYTAAKALIAKATGRPA